jgi:NADPH:quinone reductase
VGSQTKESHMKAVVFERAGEAREVLALLEVAAPTPGPDQVLLEVEASPVHPADFGFVRGAYRVKPVFPQIAGLSGVGRVVATGEGVTLTRGTRLAFRWPGAWAERVAVPVARTFVVPDDIDRDAAAQFVVNPVTAYGLLDMAQPRSGAWIGLTAASSSVAALVSALALERGLNVVGIARAASFGELAPGVHGIAESEPELAQRVRAITGDAGLAALIDCVGGPLVGALFPALEPGATVIAYGTLSPEPVTLRNATLVYGNLTWRGFGIDRWSESLSAEHLARMTADLWEGLRHNRLPLPIQACFGLADFGAGLHRAVAGGPGKIVFTPVAP